MAEEVIEISEKKSLRISDYIAFTKLRLSLLVLFSAAIGYFIAAPEFNAWQFTCLMIGGFSITVASNGFNQIFEKNLDKLMKRTMNRPLPKEKMSVVEAYILVAFFGIMGMVFLYIGTNLLCTLLSLSSLILYSFIYTPLKQKTSIAVLVGAFPGALPPLLGYVAAKGEIDYYALLLFFSQFMWQFPHFWAIAWRLDDDYKKAGFIMLPFSTGRTKENAFQILLYTLFLIPVSILPYFFGYNNVYTMIFILVAGIIFLIPAIQLYFKLEMKSATRLMFFSFLYLPIIQILMLINI